MCVNGTVSAAHACTDLVCTQTGFIGGKNFLLDVTYAYRRLGTMKIRRTKKISMPNKTSSQRIKRR